MCNKCMNKLSQVANIHLYHVSFKTKRHQNQSIRLGVIVPQTNRHKYNYNVPFCRGLNKNRLQFQQ